MIMNVAKEVELLCPLGLSYVLNMDTLEGSILLFACRIESCWRLKVELRKLCRRR